MMSNKIAKKSYDVLVVGGGVVGNTFISSLLHKSMGQDALKIAVMDIKPPPVLAECIAQTHPDIRVYALSPFSIKILDEIGAWDSIKSRAHSYLRMVIWDDSTTQHVQFSASSIPTDYLGKIAEDRVIHAALAQRIKSQSNSIDYIYDSSLQNINFIAAEGISDASCEVTIKLQDGSTEVYSTKLLVGADGANSSVRKLAGLPQWGWTYGQEAIVATVKTSRQHETAWQRYLSTGPLALLPLWGQFSSIVWSMPVLEAARMKALPEEEFKAKLNAALHDSRSTPASLPFPFSSLLPPSAPRPVPPHIASIESPRISFPLQFQQVKSYVRPRLALLGDAAHSIHPQAGQGLNLGISDAEALASSISNGLSNGEDIGTLSLLSKFGGKQYMRNLAMMGSVDSVNSLFSGRVDGLANIRGLGMKAINDSVLLKSQIAKFAMGL